MLYKLLIDNEWIYFYQNLYNYNNHVFTYILSNNSEKELHN